MHSQLTWIKPLGNAVSRPVRVARNQVRSSWRYGQFLRSFQRFRRMSDGADTKMPLRWQDHFACLADRTTQTGFDRHYVYHTAWAARVLAETRPQAHYDIGSSLYFVSLVSAFVDVRFFDYRPAELNLSGLQSERADLTALPWQDQSISSLSCMHVVEHVGLGRYGDPLDPRGDSRAMQELGRVLAPNGSLLFVVPVGKPRICYNAHRIYSYEHILDEFSPLRLKRFALIPDRAQDGGLLFDADPQLVAKQDYACGCFWFERPS